MEDSLQLTEPFGVFLFHQRNDLGQRQFVVRMETPGKIHRFVAPGLFKNTRLCHDSFYVVTRTRYENRVAFQNGRLLQQQSVQKGLKSLNLLLDNHGQIGQNTPDLIIGIIGRLERLDSHSNVLPLPFTQDH